MYSKTAMMILLVILTIVIQPLLVIWALNTLFPALAIPYTVWTWGAVVLLSMTLHYKHKG